MIPAPTLEFRATPLSGEAPLEVHLEVVSAWHPFDAEKVTVGFNGVRPDGYPTMFITRELSGGAFPWVDDVILEEEGTYLLWAQILPPPLPPHLEGVDWDFDAYDTDRVELQIIVGKNTVELPKERPVMNENFKQPYEPFTVSGIGIPVPGFVSAWDPDLPVCVPQFGFSFSALPDFPDYPEVTVDLQKSYNPDGLKIEGYFSDATFLFNGLPVNMVDPTFAEVFKKTVSSSDFNDPSVRLPLAPEISVEADSEDPLFMYLAEPAGAYLFTNRVIDSDWNHSNKTYDYVNLIAAGHEEPVAVLTSTPSYLELEEITLIQYVADTGSQLDIAGHEYDLVKVKPRGAVVVTLDASNSYDPDGQIVTYLWDIYNEGVFFHETGSDPYCTFYVPGDQWPQAIHACVMVVDNDNYVGITELIIGTEQFMPFGTKAEVEAVYE